MSLFRQQQLVRARSADILVQKAGLISRAAKLFQKVKPKVRVLPRAKPQTLAAPKSKVKPGAPIGTNGEPQVWVKGFYRTQGGQKVWVDGFWRDNVKPKGGRLKQYVSPLYEGPPVAPELARKPLKGGLFDGIDLPSSKGAAARAKAPKQRPETEWPPVTTPYEKARVKASNDVLDAMKKSDAEEGIILDADGNNIWSSISTSTTKTKNMMSIPDPKKLNGKPRDVMHAHPDDHSLSDGDLLAAGVYSQVVGSPVSITAATNAGGMYSAELRTTAEFYERAFGAAEQSYRKVIRGAGLDPDGPDMFATEMHFLNDAMAQAGIINYQYRLGNDMAGLVGGANGATMERARQAVVDYFEANGYAELVQKNRDMMELIGKGATLAKADEPGALPIIERNATAAELDAAEKIIDAMADADQQKLFRNLLARRRKALAANSKETS